MPGPYDWNVATSYRFRAELWRWEARNDSSWIFVSLPESVTDEIDDRWGGSTGGFGSIPVEVTVGTTTWSTSVFPSKEQATFVLPVKQAVRKAEGLEVGAFASIELRVALDEP